MLQVYQQGHFFDWAEGNSGSLGNVWGLGSADRSGGPQEGFRVLRCGGVDVNHSIQPNNARYQRRKPATESLSSGLPSCMDAQAEQVRGLQAFLSCANRLETDHARC